VLQPAELMAVERQPVVLRDTPELGLELRDDTEIGIDDPFRAPDGSAAVQVGRAFDAEHVGRHLQPDPRVDAAVTAPIALVVGVQDHDLVAEEPGGLRPPVRDQDLGRRQLQFELVVQELPDPRLDLLGLLPGAGEAQQPVIGLCRTRHKPA
jgi:hypothetical protein